MKKFFLLISVLPFFNAQSQIVIDNTAPFNSPVLLVDNVLLGGGVVASNHSYQGDSAQIGWFDAINTNLGISKGIVLSTGDVYALDPVNVGGFPFIANTVTDPDLLAVANSVPGMIGQNFTVTSINDVAILEFDFIPTSDSMEFRYAFGSQEYFGFENSQYNDVFGFFLSGPGIVGPWANAAINLAVVPNTNPPLPITISSVCNDPNAFPAPAIMNPQYFVDNSYINSNAFTDLDTIADADGFTTVLTARALVECGETYHIKLAIADGSDGGLSSYVWLEAGSFYSPPLEISDNLNIDSNIMSIPCNGTISLTASGGPGSTYQWFDSTSTIIGIDSSISVGGGLYVVSADIAGCAVISDTLRIIEAVSPSIDLGVDIMIACNSDTLIDPLVFGGTAPYTYQWDSGDTDSMAILPLGVYSVTVLDFYGCSDSDNLAISYDIPGTVTLSGGGSICANGTFAKMNFNFNGLLPWDLVFSNGLINQTVQAITDSNYLFETSNEGIYNVVSASDVNDCLANIVGTAQVIVHPLPVAIISPSEISIYEDDSIELEVGEYAMYHWFSADGLDLDTFSTLTVSDSGIFYVEVIDSNGCFGTSDVAIVDTKPYTSLFVPNTFTPNGDDHNELFVIRGVNIKTFNIQIFNRWGELMFTSESIDKSWDGTFANNKVQEASYYYHIEVEGNDGKVFKKGGVVKAIY